MRFYVLIVLVLFLSQCVKKESEFISFKDFPVSSIYTGEIAPLNISGSAIEPSDTEAMRFFEHWAGETPLEVNFAGHYMLIPIPCGTMCEAIFIVDVITGKVFPTGEPAELGMRYKTDSQLLIVNPKEHVQELFEDDIPNWVTTQMFVWEENRLKLIREISY